MELEEKDAKGSSSYVEHERDSAGANRDDSYTDMAAIKAHGGAKEFQEFSKLMKTEDLAAKPMEVKFVKKVAGFARL